MAQITLTRHNIISIFQKYNILMEWHYNFFSKRRKKNCKTFLSGTSLSNIMSFTCRFLSHIGINRFFFFFSIGFVFPAFTYPMCKQKSVTALTSAQVTSENEYHYSSWRNASAQSGACFFQGTASMSRLSAQGSIPGPIQHCEFLAKRWVAKGPWILVDNLT